MCRTGAIGVLVALFLGSAPAARACRLESLLARLHTSGARPVSWLLATAFDATAFDLDGISGHYARVTTRAQYVRLQSLAVGAEVAVIQLHRNDLERPTSGLGNPLLFGLCPLPAWRGGSVELGLQLGLPLGDAADGLASDHWEVLPHVGVAHEGRRLDVLADGGVRVALGGGHEDCATPTATDAPPLSSDTPLFVDPHAEKELLYRFGANLHDPYSTRNIALYVDAQHVLGNDSAISSQVALGLEAGLQLGPRYRLHPGLEVPITASKREDWSLRLEVRGFF